MFGGVGVCVICQGGFGWVCLGFLVCLIWCFKCFVARFGFWVIVVLVAMWGDLFD